MKIRTVYFKVSDIAKAAHFWAEFLQIKPHKDFDDWKEFMCGTTRFALLLSSDKQTSSGSDCVPAFELEKNDIHGHVLRAQKLGASIVFDGLNDADIKSIVLRAPHGHEFELSMAHE